MSVSLCPINIETVQTMRTIVLFTLGKDWIGNIFELRVQYNREGFI